MMFTLLLHPLASPPWRCSSGIGRKGFNSVVTGLVVGPGLADGCSDVSRMGGLLLGLADSGSWSEAVSIWAALTATQHELLSPGPQWQ